MSIGGSGADWAGLEAMMAADSSWRHSGRVLSIVRNTPLQVFRGGRLVGGRKKALMDMDGGRVFNSLMSEVFPNLRKVDVLISYSPTVPMAQVPFLSTAPEVPAPAPFRPGSCRRFPRSTAWR